MHEVVTLGLEALLDGGGGSRKSLNDTLSMALKLKATFKDRSFPVDEFKTVFLRQ